MPRSYNKLGTDGYVRPKVTYTDTLSPEKIEEMLQGYEKVDDLENVPIDSHIRYFVRQPDGTQLFRSGGFLCNKSGLPKYITLTNRKSSWSVQLENATIFRKLSHQEEIESLHRHYKNKIKRRDLTIKQLKAYVHELEKAHHQKK